MKKQTGFTLIELIISLSIGLFIVAAAIAMFMGTFNSSANTVKSSRLNYDMDSVMVLMINDIKRAGYSADSVVETDTRDNLFTIGSANIHMPVPSCILYTYDYDGDGELADASGKNEFFGFKLDNGEIKISSAKTVDATGDCSITDGRWETITDRKTVNITALQFSFLPVAGTLAATTRCLNNTNIPPDPTSSDTTCDIADNDALNKITSGDQLVENRIVNIIMTGEVDDSDDTTVSRTLSETVQIRNNRVFEQP